MTAASRTRLARAAHGVAADWALRVTRGLPEDVARDRFEQIVSDLWEHAAAADRARIPGRRLAAQILGRTLRGIPADLAWRAGAVRGAVAPLPRPAVAGRAPLVADGHRFDQTNGAIDFDVASPARPDTTVEDLVGKAVVANTISVGFGGSI